MKKFILGMALLLSINAFGHHLNTLGWCSFQNGRAFFSTGGFANNLDVEIRYDLTGPGNGGTNWINASGFMTPVTGVTTTVFSVPQATMSTNKTVVQFRYRVHDTSPGGAVTPGSWTGWSDNNTTTSTTYVGCSQLPVKFYEIKVALTKKPK